MTTHNSTHPFTFRPRLRAGFIAVLTALSACWAPAQTPPTGTVTGRVAELATGRSLQGAVVRVNGTTSIDSSDAEGRFNLPAVPVGSYQLEVDYVGLDPFFQDITVAAGETVTIVARLGSAVLEMETFTVSEAARGQAQAINQQKTAEGIVNIVSEETFGSMVGGNIGYALQRLPGLTVNESEDGTPNGVNIRGLESKYNSFQIDGNRIPTSGTGRGFGTSQLNADGIANIEVIKAATPDRDGDAIGGIINVTSRSAFQRDGRSVQVTGSGVFYDKTDTWGYNAGLVYSDLFSVFGGENNLGISLSASAYETSKDYDNLDKDYTYLSPAAYPALNLAEPVYFHTNGTPQTNERTTENQGVNLAIDYRLSDRATFYVKPFWSGGETTAQKYRARYYTTESNSNIAAVTYNTGQGRDTALTNIRIQGEDTHDTNDLSGLSLGGRHELDTIIFNYDLFFSTNESARDHGIDITARNPGFAIAYDQTIRHEPVYTIRNGANPRDPSTINRADIGVTTNDGNEDAKSVKADWEKKFAGDVLSGSIKFGAKYRENEKTRDETDLNYRTGNASVFPYAEVLRPTDKTAFGIPLLFLADMPKLEALMQSNPSLFTLDKTAAAVDALLSDFTAKEEITAAYVMGTVTRGRHQMITGLRLEHNTFESDTWRFDETQPTTPIAVRASRDYDVWLPGIHFRHELRPNLILRESYNRSYSRPDMDALVAGIEVDEQGNASGGNPNLKETTSDNFDVQLEYYTDRAGLYSVGFFYKDMKGFYYERTYNFSQYDAGGYPIPDAAGPYEFSTTDNALGATNYGVELIARQNLYFLPAPLDGFSVSLSATFTESDGKYPGRLDEELPTYGFSDQIYYAALEYVRGKFRGQISYRYRSDYLEGLDGNNTLDDWFGANESLDWESSYQVTPKLKVFLNVNNLTDEPQISYQGYTRTDNPEDYTTYSWRATIGANYTF